MPVRSWSAALCEAPGDGGHSCRCVCTDGSTQRDKPRQTAATASSAAGRGSGNRPSRPHDELGPKRRRTSPGSARLPWDRDKRSAGEGPTSAAGGPRRRRRDTEGAPPCAREPPSWADRSAWFRRRAPAPDRSRSSVGAGRRSDPAAKASSSPSRSPQNPREDSPLTPRGQPGMQPFVVVQVVGSNVTFLQGWSDNLPTSRKGSGCQECGLERSVYRSGHPGVSGSGCQWSPAF